MSQSGFAEKPQRAKKWANEWCEDFSKYRKAGGAAVGRGMSPPEEIAVYVTVRICGETAAGEKTGERMVRGFFGVPQGGQSGNWPGDEPAGRRDETVPCPSAGRRPRINQKCAEYSRVKQWDGSPPPNCGEENENGA